MKIYRGSMKPAVGQWWSLTPEGAWDHRPYFVKAELPDTARIKYLTSADPTYYHSLQFLLEMTDWNMDTVRKLLADVNIVVAHDEEEWDYWTYDTAEEHGVDLVLYPEEKDYFVATDRAWKVADRYFARLYEGRYDAIIWDFEDVQVLNPAILENVVITRKEAEVE